MVYMELYVRATMVFFSMGVSRAKLERKKASYVRREKGASYERFPWCALYGLAPRDIWGPQVLCTVHQITTSLLSVS